MVTHLPSKQVHVGSNPIVRSISEGYPGYDRPGGLRLLYGQGGPRDSNFGARPLDDPANSLYTACLS